MDELNIPGFMRKTIVSLLTPFLLCGLKAPTALALPSGPAHPSPTSASGLTLSSIDRSVDPGRDFYLYANGGWLKQHPVPPQLPEWGRFNELMQKNGGELYKILVTCALSHSPQGTIEQKLGDFYLSGMNADRLDRQGIQPLKHDLEQIRGVTDMKTLEAVVISLHQRGIEPFFDLSSRQDAHDSHTIIGEISQSGLGLPEQGYYFRTDDRSVKQRAAYQDHLVQAFRHLGYTEAEAKPKADQVFAVEKRLAQASLSEVEMRDPLKLQHPISQSDLGSGVGTWSWSQYLEALGVSPQARFNVQSPKYLEALYSLWDSTDMPSLRSYLEWRLLDTSCNYLSEELATFDFDFRKLLSGAPTQIERNARVLSIVNRYMSEAMGQKYSEKYFSAKAKTRVSEMAELLVKVLDEDFNHLTWMGPETQKEAHTKLAALRFKIGRPDVWIDYSALRITPEGFLENVWRARAFASARDFAKIGKPLDPGEWYMSPATVNAYYDPQKNEVVIPSAIMQPPFFSAEGDDSMNYGALGAVLGHEITHGFDDEGRKYDEHGNLRDWWAPDDLKRFQDLAALVEDEYSAYTVLDGHMHLNGKLVVGESIADLGGVKLAYLAYQDLLKKRPSKVIEGFTPEQRFFLSYASLWAENTRSDYERLQVNVSKHPPGHYRVDGPLSSFPEFARAFHCAPGSPMVREKPIVLW
jgi:putative endopeptidase